MRYINYAENTFSPLPEGVWNWYVNPLEFAGFLFLFFSSVVSISFPQDLDTFSFSFKQEASENKFELAVVTAASEAETGWVCGGWWYAGTLTEESGPQVMNDINTFHIEWLGWVRQAEKKGKIVSC